MSKAEPIYVLSQNGQERFRGTETECYKALQRMQPQSARWAMRYEGWKVTPVKK